MPKVVITKANMPKVLSILDKWKGKLTMDLYAAEVAKALGLDGVDRGTLYAYPEIKKAFQLKKQRIRDADAGDDSKNVTIEMLEGEVEKYKSRVVRLEQKLNLYKEQFVRWQYNLQMMPGVDFEKINKELDNPLPPIDRAS